MPDSKLSALTANPSPLTSDLLYVVSANASFKETVATLLVLGGSKTYIAGLELIWISASAVDIGIGAAYVESVGAPILVPSIISLTGLSLGNSVWGYVYLKSDGTAECNTTAPAAAYAGNARSKASDTTRRFLGTVRTDSSGNIYRFRHTTTSGLIKYQAIDQAASPFRVLSAGSATTSTAVSCASVVPPQSRVVFIALYETATNIATYWGSADYTVSATLHDATTFGLAASGYYYSLSVLLTLNTSQQFNYLNSAGSGTAYADVLGYVLER